MRETIALHSQKVIQGAFYLLFFITPFIFFSYQLKTNTSELFEINKMFFVYLQTVVICGAWGIKSIALEHKIFKRSFMDIPLLLFFLSQLLSTIGSIDIHTSLWGYYSRGNGGLLSIISYSLLYWAYVSNMGIIETKKALRLLIASAGIISLWGIFEHFGSSPSCILIRGKLSEFNDSCWVQDLQNRVFATLGQPNWLAAWVVAIAPLAWWQFNSKFTPEGSSLIQNAKLQLKVQNLIIPILLVVSTLAVTLFTKSRSGILGFVIAFGIFSALYLAKTKNIKSILLVTFLLSLVTLLAGTPWTPSLLDKLSSQQPSTNSLSGTSLENGGTESGNIRKIVWTGALNIWRANPILGTGVETFGYSYYQYRPIEHNNTSEWELLYNKAHNEYLNYLANTGLVGLGTYLLLILSTVLLLTKSTNKSLKIRMLAFRDILRLFSDFSEKQSTQINQIQLLIIALLSGYASILITNFFGFSVVTVQLLFFLFPAMVVTLFSPTTNSELPTTKTLSFKQIIGITILLLVSCLFVLRVFSIWHADILYTASQSENNRGLEGQAFIDIRKALDSRSDEPLYFDQLSRVSANLAITENEKEDATQSAKFAGLAKDSTEVATSISPYNLSLWKSQSVIYQKLALIDPTNLKDAVKPLETAVSLAPTDPKVRYNLGVIYDHLGRTQDAQKTLEQTIQLKPDYYDARVGLAKVYVELKIPEKAREQYQWILDHLNGADQDILDALKNLPQVQRPNAH